MFFKFLIKLNVTEFQSNLKSIKSNINCGMKKIGKFEEGFFVKNRYDDVLIFAMTKKEYKRFNS